MFPLRLVILLQHVQRKRMYLSLQRLHLLSFFIRNLWLFCLLDQLCILKLLADQRLLVALIVVHLLSHLLLLLLDHLGELGRELDHIVLSHVS